MDKEKIYAIMKFQCDEVEIEVNINIHENTIWLTQDQLALLFNTSKQNISLHTKSILNERELESSTVKENLTVRLANQIII